MVDLFVPGRLCLFGEHSDWAGALRRSDASLAPGACLITGTEQGIWAEATAAADLRLVAAPDNAGASCSLPMQAQALHAAAVAGGFFSYAAGVAAVVAERFPCGGVAIRETACDLPVARGLSSSAAICVLTARAFNRVYDLGLDIDGEMGLAYLGELATGSQCGRMDQACAYGRRLVALEFDGDAMRATPLKVASPLHFLIVDLQQPKNTRRILEDLHRAFDRGGEIREALGARNLDLVARARQALSVGDACSVGALMAEAQSLFDRCLAPASAELRAPRLHALLAHAAARELAWGGKGVGSQGDGAAQFICRGSEERERLARRIEADALGRCLRLTLEA
jgi:galactokinase